MQGLGYQLTGRQDNDISPAGQMELAEQLLRESQTTPGGMAGPWSQNRVEVSKIGFPSFPLK